MSIKNVIEWKSFDKFQKNMINVLIEKAEKYKNKWKTTGYNGIFFKLTSIVNSMINITNITNMNPNNPKKTQRKLIHIANYAYFLYTRLESIL